MPGVPIEIPSETVMVLKVIALAPARSAPAATRRASSSICILQGVKLLHVEATPTWGFSKSSSRKPTARSIERLGACFSPSTTKREWRRVSTVVDFFGMAPSLRSRLRNAVALDQVAINSPQCLSLAADTSAGTVLGVPRVKIDVHPRRFGDKALEEQSAEDCARKCRGCN